MIDVKPPAMDRSGHALLREMLRQRNQSPERVEEIDREILATFQRRLAVLVLDMCGFSRLTAKHGALFYLSMIVQMEEAATPAVLNNGGRVIKQEADNFFAVFEAPVQALEAALDIFVAFRAVNSVVPDDRDITASVGIGFGDLLDTGDDVFGDEMNAPAGWARTSPARRRSSSPPPPPKRCATASSSRSSASSTTRPTAPASAAGRSSASATSGAASAPPGRDWFRT